MPVAPDPYPAFVSYAHPHRLVTTEWLSANLGVSGLKIIECNADVLLYGIGHVPGASKLDWRSDLDDPVTRDYIDGERFTELMRSQGIEHDDTVVLYGNDGNSHAAHALWVFTMFGHADVRLLDGGRDVWIAESRDTVFETPEPTRSRYPAVVRDDTKVRAFREDVLDQLGTPLIDVRSPQEYAGFTGATGPDTVLRGGHIPTAMNIPWTDALAPDGRFRGRAELDAIYGEVPGTGPVTVYSAVGERSSHTWFVLEYLLGRESVRNYDGSWTEWGNSVRMPIATGSGVGAVGSGAR
ncbi:sulfurtransferase [Nocardia sp. NBC_00416]|uniref:sulfurtransferase n=1 Tax=Nocardia sp. NBC_00416 TaxID=2975991 RepID=UPI002E1D7857